MDDRSGEFALRLLARLGASPHSAIVATRASGEEVRRSFSDFADDVARLSQRLSAAGLGRGHSVGIQSANCYEWLVLDVAVSSLGAILLAFPEDMPGQQVASFTLTHDLALLVVQQACDDNSDTVTVDIARLEADLPVKASARRTENPDLFSRVFSSGTSGKIKGLDISQRGVSWLIEHFIRDFKLSEKDRHLIFLPLSSYQQRLSFYGCVLSGASVCLTTYPRVFHALKSFNPTFLIAPPILYDTALTLCAGKDIATHLPKVLGGNVRFLITGMAAIKHKTLELYAQAGLKLLEAYGVTECGMVAWNTEDRQQPGTVGQPLLRSDILIAEDDEILICRTMPLCHSYFFAEEEEAAATFRSDGAIATGDLGHFDESGFLTLLGRKKDIIVTAGGKKFHPSEIERLLIGQPEVDECFVFSDMSSNQVALVLHSATQSGEEWKLRIRQLVDAVNAQLDPHQRIGKVIHSDYALSADSRFQTRNMKISRSALSRHFSRNAAQPAEA